MFPHGMYPRSRGWRQAQEQPLPYFGPRGADLFLCLHNIFHSALTRRLAAKVALENFDGRGLSDEVCQPAATSDI